MEAAGDRDQLSQGEWAQAAGLGTAGALQAALQAGSAAERHLVSEHKGFLMSLVNKYAHQVQLHCVCICSLLGSDSPDPKFHTPCIACEVSCCARSFFSNDRLSAQRLLGQGFQRFVCMHRG